MRPLPGKSPATVDAAAPQGRGLVFVPVEALLEEATMDRKRDANPYHGRSRLPEGDELADLGGQFAECDVDGDRHAIRLAVPTAAAYRRSRPITSSR